MKNILKLFSILSLVIAMMFFGYSTYPVKAQAPAPYAYFTAVPGSTVAQCPAVIVNVTAWCGVETGFFQSIKGAQWLAMGGPGPTGPQGAAGATGPAGPQGPAGAGGSVTVDGTPVTGLADSSNIKFTITGGIGSPVATLKSITASGLIQ